MPRLPGHTPHHAQNRSSPLLIALACLLVAACAAGAEQQPGTGGQSGTVVPGANGGAGQGSSGGTNGGRGNSIGTSGRGMAGGGAGGVAGGVAGGAAGGAAGGGSGTSGAGGSSAGATGGAGGAAGGGGTAGAAPPVSGNAGNPSGSCGGGIPARGQPADTSSPTTVVGTGTAASCSFSQLQAAVTKGGVITFNCGPDPMSIAVTATLSLPTNKNTVIDGGNQITLDGKHAVEIMRFDSPDFRANDNGLTLQHIALINGKQTPTAAIPSAPAPCSQGWDDGEGGALYVRDGALTVIDSIFMDNEAAPLGPDTGGGAIYIVGSKAGAMIVSSTFSGNSASNAGAVGALHAELDIYDSLFTNNTATGHDANDNDASKCSVMNNGQNEIGSGGNGGAVYSDGVSVDVTLCGDAILDNAAGMNAFGGGLFFTSNDMMGVLSIIDSTITGNTGGHWTNVSTGSVKNVGTAVGVNAHSITVSNSTIQGYP